MNEKTDSIKKITSCNLISMSINPIKLVFILIETNFLVSFFNIWIVLYRKNIIAIGTIQREIYIGKYE